MEGRARILGVLPGGQDNDFAAVSAALGDYLGFVAARAPEGKTPDERKRQRRAQAERASGRLSAVREAALALSKALSSLTVADRSQIRRAWMTDEHVIDDFAGVLFSTVDRDWPSVLALLSRAAEAPTGRPKEWPERLLCSTLAELWRRVTGRLPSASNSEPSPFQRFVAVCVAELPRGQRPGSLPGHVRAACANCRRAFRDRN